MPEGQNNQTDKSQTGDQNIDAENNSQNQVIKFDEWLAKQEEPVRKAYEQHVTGLKNTVQATRDERDALSRQIRDLLPKAEKGSELERSLIDVAAKLDAAEKRAVFAEEASKPEIGCSNPKAAYLLAVADSLFDRKGSPDWTAIRAAAPELFTKTAARSNAGNGTSERQSTNLSMNDYIRQAAGHKQT